MSPISFEWIVDEWKCKYPNFQIPNQPIARLQAIMNLCCRLVLYGYQLDELTEAQKTHIVNKSTPKTWHNPKKLTIWRKMVRIDVEAAIHHITVQIISGEIVLPKLSFDYLNT